ncbi:hypothetical protein LCGC14_2622640 [marine sediment metagenome]|uniref:Uncharacterized protein n=1 Tax=marine sediment metagenome TaxID=412755 RepID=A0A0F9A2K7_9ZZZZ|nr:hypothetical protein [Candidatus Scalindua sp.]
MMKTLVYCYDVEDLESVDHVTETVRKIDWLPNEGDVIFTRLKTKYENWEVVRRVFNHKGGGTIDLVIKNLNTESINDVMVERKH